MTFTDRFDNATLPSELARAATAWPDREAYVFEDGRLTFAETARRAAGVAAGLIALGVQRGDRVVVLMAGYSDWPAVYFGVTATGAILVPLNTRLTAVELGDLILRSGAVALIYRADGQRGSDLQGRVRAALDALPADRRPRHVISTASDPCPGEATLAQLVEEGAGSDQIVAAERVSPQSVAAIIYTSGSTGPSKGAMLNHRAMLRGAWYGCALLEAGPQDRLFSPQPYFHAGGAVQVMLAPVVCGLTSITQAYFDVAAALATMERERCTLTLGHQPHWVDYLAQPDIQTRRLVLRSAYVIGDPKIRRDIHERLGLVTISPYAMTETHLGGVSPTLADGLDACLNTNGRAFPGVDLVIRDVDSDEPVAAGHVGEICLGGWCPMDGYLDEPALTAQAFDGDGAVRTGDLGIIGEDGNLRLVGRRKEMIRIGGENVSPSEVADVLCGHPAVKQAVVVAMDDDRLGEVVGAAVECHRGASIDTPEIQAYCSQRLARYKVPRHIEMVTQWPMTGTGKIDRVAVRAHVGARAQLGARGRSAGVPDGV